MKADTANDALLRALHGEQGGAAYFTALASTTRKESAEYRRAKILAAVELEMAERIATTLAARGVCIPTVGDTSALAERGRRDEWPAFCETIQATASEAIDGFKALGEYELELQPLAATLIAHEQALLDVARDSDAALGVARMIPYLPEHAARALTKTLFQENHRDQ